MPTPVSISFSENEANQILIDDGKKIANFLAFFFNNPGGISTREFTSLSFKEMLAHYFYDKNLLVSKLNEKLSEVIYNLIEGQNVELDINISEKEGINILSISILKNNKLIVPYQEVEIHNNTKFIFKGES
jgi:hypothetical protein